MPTHPFASVLHSGIVLIKRLSTIQPKEAKVTLGVDIGSASIKVIALGPKRPGGGRAILGQHAAMFKDGPDSDGSEALKSAVEAVQPGVKVVNVAVSGPWVIMRVVEMPTLKPSEMKQALPFEAQRYLPFNIQEVMIDGVVLGPSDANKSWVLVVACKKELIERRLDWARRAGLEVSLIDVDAVAVANAFLSSAEKKEQKVTRALINVGAQFTNVVIFQGQIPYLVRDIPWGAEKFTRSVAEQSGLDPAVVAQELVHPGTAGAELGSAMKTATDPLLTELQLSFDYFENRFGQPPEELLVCGGLGEAAGFVNALKSHLTQTVSAWTPAEGLSGRFAVAYGLALRAG